MVTMAQKRRDIGATTHTHMGRKHSLNTRASTQLQPRGVALIIMPIAVDWALIRNDRSIYNHVVSP